MRVHELAWEVGVSSADMLARLRSEGEYVTSHMSSVPAPFVRALRAETTAAPRPPRWMVQPRATGPIGPVPRVSPAARRWRRKPGPARRSFEEPASNEYDDPIDDLRHLPELTTYDVARLLNVKPGTVRQWVARGYLRPSDNYRTSHVFETRDVLLAYDRIKERDNSYDRPGVNIRPKLHDSLVDVRAAARLAKVAPSTIRTWIHRGHLTPVAGEGSEVRLRIGDVFGVACGVRRHKPRTRKT
jgi:hypothetical protein